MLTIYFKLRETDRRVCKSGVFVMTAPCCVVCRGLCSYRLKTNTTPLKKMIGNTVRSFCFPEKGNFGAVVTKNKKEPPVFPHQTTDYIRLASTSFQNHVVQKAESFPQGWMKTCGWMWNDTDRPSPPREARAIQRCMGKLLNKTPSTDRRYCTAWAPSATGSRKI